jgi:hypothetical protein
MRSFAVATAIVALWVCPTHAIQSSNMFASTSHDFGTVARAAKTEHRFYFDNPYDKPLHVRSARTSCGARHLSSKRTKFRLAGAAAFWLGSIRTRTRGNAPQR